MHPLPNMRLHPSPHQLIPSYSSSPSHLTSISDSRSTNILCHPSFPHFRSPCFSLPYVSPSVPPFLRPSLPLAPFRSHALTFISSSATYPFPCNSHVSGPFLTVPSISAWNLYSQTQASQNSSLQRFPSLSSLLIVAVLRNVEVGPTCTSLHHSPSCPYIINL